MLPFNMEPVAPVETERTTGDKLKKSDRVSLGVSLHVSPLTHLPHSEFLIAIKELF